MYRPKKNTTGRSGLYCLSIVLLFGAVGVIATGCTPDDQGTDPVISPAGGAVSQILGFVSDFARQLLAAFLF
ncbi:hypothetical protein RAS2_18310 [Phycisphaerae bacterium RAS2]|nr:hypothetical protein RAS2_18310 [Phycisphaerae bacterium RAS2]